MNNLEWKEEKKPTVKTLKEAKRLSLLKWNYIVKNDGKSDGLHKAYPELIGLLASCGLCELCVDNDNPYHSCNYGKDKTPCPLVIDEDTTCGASLPDVREMHTWSIWNEHRTKENAKVMLDMIKAIDV